MNVSVEFVVYAAALFRILIGLRRFCFTSDCYGVLSNFLFGLELLRVGWQSETVWRINFCLRKLN